MEASLFYGYIALLAFFVIAYKLLFQTQRHRNLPPFPVSALPIIGHLHLVKPPFHRVLHQLSKKCGPIFSLKFGSRLVVVVASPSAAEECFTKNDVVLANRIYTLVAEYVGYKASNLVDAPFGDHWRRLRRLATEEILSPASLMNFQSIRYDEAKQLLRTLVNNSRTGFAKVELKSKFSELAFNVITRMVAGKRYCGDGNLKEEGEKFRGLIQRMFEQAGASNPEDFLPILRWIDYRGLEKGLAKLAKELDELFQGLIDEHRREKRNTMIGRLLSLQESDPELCTDQTISGLVMIMLVTGSDTTASTIEWAMSLLLNHPDALKKAREELDLRVGHDRLVDESDLSELHYLQCIISETFRLCPAGPLLVPHQASDDCSVQGYNIPRGTILLVNAWAIHRDPDVWEDPTSFRPERFERKTVDPYTLLPFGRGRRSCPGSGLAQRVVGLVLGSLIHCFEWERISDEKVNMDEGFGLTMPKAQPLEALCKARPFMDKIFPI